MCPRDHGRSRCVRDATDVSAAYARTGVFMLAPQAQAQVQAQTSAREDAATAMCVCDDNSMCIPLPSLVSVDVSDSGQQKTRPTTGTGKPVVPPSLPTPQMALTTRCAVPGAPDSVWFPSTERLRCEFGILTTAGLPPVPGSLECADTYCSPSWSLRGIYQRCPVTVKLPDAFSR